ncbi:MAG TPA: ATP-dependent sacrificial sulfur transferase LarE [Wenzhouxiangella sp.]|nr:ATP-dependent sacrificial sulfur transferase LarE [Wenzhouxiangella sp.]
MTLDDKYMRLQEILRTCGSILVSFSGGVDSTFLLRVAREVLGTDQVAAFTATSPTYPLHEFEQSRELARQMGVRQIVVDSNELKIPGFSENTPLRCYHCKKELFTLCRRHADALGLETIADGSNLDDLQDHRPGRQAAQELQVRSPLLEAGLTKEDIRALSHRLNLPTWDKQALACLSSRFPYGTEITADRLEQVAHCENFLKDKGFDTYRVRYHGDLARIELSSAGLTAVVENPELRQELVQTCKQAGFTYVTLDLQGYRTGSMNEVL